MGNFPAIIIDFETTGLSPDMGDRTIEVGAVRIAGTGGDADAVRQVPRPVADRPSGRLCGLVCQ